MEIEQKANKPEIVLVAEGDPIQAPVMEDPYGESEANCDYYC